jgi:hypothetical protein
MPVFMRRNYRKILGDDLTVVWLGKVARRRGVGNILDNLPRCTAAETGGEGEKDEGTQNRSPLPKTLDDVDRSVHLALQAI